MPPLYLTQQNAFASKDGDTLVIRYTEKTEEQAARRRYHRVPLHKVTEVIVFGNVTLSTPLLTALLKTGTSVTYLTRWGKYVGTLGNGLSNNGQVRRGQHALAAHLESAFAIARACVEAKLSNQRVLVLRSGRYRESAALRETAEKLRETLGAIRSIPQPEGLVADIAHRQRDSAFGALFGYEGRAGRDYFSTFGEMLNDDWNFSGRNRRPPRDPVNALLSFGYALLTGQCIGACYAAGLDPFTAFLHAPVYARPALALDLMEEFRPVIVDSVVLRVINTGQLTPTDFEERLGGVYMSDTARRTFVEAYERRMNTEVIHPLRGETMTYREVILTQARLLAKVCLGEEAEYRPFLVR